MSSTVTVERFDRRHPYELESLKRMFKVVQKPEAPLSSMFLYPFKNSMWESTLACERHYLISHSKMVLLE